MFDENKTNTRNNHMLKKLTETDKAERKNEIIVKCRNRNK